MQIGEFLVKLGVDADTKKAEKFSQSLKKVATVATVAVGALTTMAGTAFAFFDNQIHKTEELSKTKNGLIDITQKEVALSKEYQESTKRLSSNFEMLKTKIALGVAPQMLSITERTNAFLNSNKKLITDGLQKVVRWLFNFAEGTFGVFRSLNDLITKTVGWKGALYILIGVLALVKKATIAAFIANPITWIMAAIAGLILLVDDLMTYMRGGKSMLGSYWDPFIKAVRVVNEWWNTLGDTTKEYIKTTGTVIGALAMLANYVPLVGKAFKFAFMLAGKAVLYLGRVMITNPILAIIALIAGAAYLIYKNWDDLPGFFKRTWDKVVNFTKNAWKSILMWFGMSEEQAESTVNAIGEIFSVVFDLITFPFKQIYKFIKGMFEIWGDDSKSTVEKIGDTFMLVIDLIKYPFQVAFDWVAKKFSFVTDTISKGINKLKFWKDDVDFTASANMMSSAVPAVGNATSQGGNKIINGGDQKIDIHVNDTESARVISSEIQRGGNKMAQYNAQLAGGF